jgi:hypothetical protein
MEYDNLIQQQDKNRYVKYSLGVLLLNAGIKYVNKKNCFNKFGSHFSFSFYGWTAIFFTYVSSYLGMPQYGMPASSGYHCLSSCLTLEPDRS